jgi:LacI family transcriptional regulator
VVVGDIVDPYFAEITRGVEDRARKAGSLTMVCNADRTTAAELAYLRVLRDYHAEGIIFAGGGYTADPGWRELTATVAEAQAEGVRVISLAVRGFDTPLVTFDDTAVAYDVTSHLAGLGHRRIAFVAGPAGLSTSTLRLAGFRHAMRDAGLPDDLLHPGDFGYASGRTAALGMIAAGLPDAVVGANDESAIGVVMALRQAGVDVPGQVSVAGIGDTRASRFVDLTTVSVPMYELGALAAERILEAGTPPPPETILAHRLVARSTTRRRT